MGWFSKLFTGVDLDEEAKRNAELEEWRGRLDANPRMERVWEPADWYAHERQMASEAAAFNATTYDDQVWQAAREGAVEGLENMQGAVKDTLSGAAGFTLKGVFGFIPGWVWAVGLVGGGLYAAWHLGLLRNLIKR
jgi:hypothetical protein